MVAFLLRGKKLILCKSGQLNLFIVLSQLMVPTLPFKQTALLGPEMVNKPRS